MEEAQRLFAAGVTAAEAGDLSTAESNLVRALGLLGLDTHGRPLKPRLPDRYEPGERRLAARLLLSLAFSSHELGRDAAAREALDDAQRIRDPDSDSDIDVVIYGQRGAMLLREGRLAESLEQLNQAERLIAYAPVNDQCKILVNRSEVQGLLGHVAMAKADCTRALQLARAHEPATSTQAFYATHNLGLFEFLSGDLPRALELMPLVDDAHNDFERGVVGTDRAKVLLNAGLVSEADRSLVEACAALARTELVQFRAEAELLRAEVALLAGNSALARSLSQAAVTRLRSRDNRRATALGELVLLRAEAAAGAPTDQLIRVADRLARTFTRLNLPDQAGLARLVAIEHLAPQQARTRPLPRISKSQPLELRLHGRLVRATLAFARGDRGSGLRHARIGLAELSEYQTQFGSLDLQTSSAVRARSLAAAAITAEIAAGRPAAVLAWVERARAVSGRVLPLQPPQDEVTADLLTQLRWTASQTEREQTAGRDTTELRRQRQILERKIRERSWTVHGSGAALAEPRTADLRHALGESVLVTLFNLNEVVHAVVLTGRDCWLRRLAALPDTEELGRRIRADLDVLALDQVPDPLRGSAQRSLQRSLEQLDELLIRPLDLLDAPVVLLPPGRLTSVPWAQLPSFVGRPVTVAPSASTWLGAHARFVFAPGPVVAVAGPGLRRATSEVERVADTWPGCQVLRPDEVTVSAFLSSVNGAQLVHVAAHGRHQRENPLFSEIALADGPVVGYDLDRVPDPPQQVVLSACDLGQATVRPGEEALGLTRAFLHSGTSTVVAGVAKVSDRGAADLMTEYHRRLASGSPPAYALAEALTAAEEPIPFACFGAGW